MCWCAQRAASVCQSVRLFVDECESVISAHPSAASTGQLEGSTYWYRVQHSCYSTKHNSVQVAIVSACQAAAVARMPWYCSGSDACRYLELVAAVLVAC